jgi:hypothetical protein
VAAGTTEGLVKPHAQLIVRSLAKRAPPNSAVASERPCAISAAYFWFGRKQRPFVALRYGKQNSCHEALLPDSVTLVEPWMRREVGRPPKGPDTQTVFQTSRMRPNTRWSSINVSVLMFSVGLKSHMERTLIARHARRRF